MEEISVVIVDSVQDAVMFKALCPKCYSGCIVKQTIDEMVVFFCDKCYKEVTIEEFKDVRNKR